MAHLAQHASKSEFVIGGRMPSSALIDKFLREIAAKDSGQALNAHVVDKFCERIRESAELIDKETQDWTVADRNEVFHYILLMITYAVDASMLNADPLEPIWSQPYRLHFLDWGGASPDGCYRRVMLRDDRAYRVWGTLGNAAYFSMDCRQSKPYQAFLRDDLKPDAEGNFELFLGGDERPGNWRPLKNGATGIVTREFYGDWNAARRSHLRIECLDGATAPRREYKAEHIAAAFDLVGEWLLEGALRYWFVESRELATTNKNKFPEKFYRSGNALPVASNAWCELKDDEVLLIEVPDPQADHWGTHFTTTMWRTLDYANRLTTFNQAQAHLDADGVYRLIVSPTDPGVYNWLDTTGLNSGILITRFCGAKNAAPPKTKLLKRADLGRELPNTRRVTPEQRRAQIAERREGVSHMVCD
jgi:hypothetical protein